CNDDNAIPPGLDFDDFAARVLASYCGYSDEACRDGPDGSVSHHYYTYDLDSQCGEWTTTVTE
ncbi:hypothetical protein AAVH_33722, partial [Aphelenchoides avenae]